MVSYIRNFLTHQVMAIIVLIKPFFLWWGDVWLIDMHKFVVYWQRRQSLNLLYAALFYACL